MRTLQREGSSWRQTIPWEEVSLDATAWRQRELLWRSLPQQLVRTPRTISLNKKGLCLESTWYAGLDLRQYAEKTDSHRAFQKFFIAARKLHLLHVGSPAVLHGDVSPKNVLVTPANVIWIDPESLERCDATSAHSVFRAKPAYLAPERARSGRNSVAAEVFACAAIAFELLHGQPLFPHSHEGFVEALGFSEVQCDHKVALLPRRYQCLMRRGLAPEPRGRQDSVLIFLEELQHAFC